MRRYCKSADATARRTRTQGWGAVLVAGLAIASTGCLFGTSLDVFVSPNEDGTLTVSVSMNSTLDNCSQDTVTQYTCIYFVDGFPHISIVNLVGPAALFAVMIDPLVLQMPATVANLVGTYSFSGGASGSLLVSPGAASVPADATQTMMADPGNRLWVLDLPPGAPTTGDVSFNINFTVPGGTTSLPVKPVLTGRVVSGMETFYPPLLPCVIDLSGLMPISLPVTPPGGPITLPPPTGLGCPTTAYNFGAPVPGLPPWALALLTASLLALAARRIRWHSGR